MSAWNQPAFTEDLTAALQGVASSMAENTVVDQGAAPAEPSAPAINPNKAQEHGWAKPVPYNYEDYAMSNKQLAEETAAFTGEAVQDVGVGGLHAKQWHSEAAVYVWDEEYGDIGPEHPELEKQLFGAENHVRRGDAFATIADIDVVQEGKARIEPVRDFESAGLHPAMLNNVRLAGYDHPTPVQAYAMAAIAKGHDLVACAQTGSGKTAAFLIPILSKLMGKAKKLAAPRPNPATFQPGVNGVRAEPLVLIVCPNRELATQIFDEARRFCYRTMLRPCVVYGGGPVKEQLAQLEKGCDILIGTPGRLVDMIVNKSHALTLKRLKYFVIDEADEMLHSDWDTELQQIMSGGDQEEGNIIYMMFSATFPKALRDVAKQHMKFEHARIRVGRAGSSHGNIKQDVLEIEPSQKKKALLDLLYAAPPCRTIIFVNSKPTCDEIDDFLFNAGFPVTAIHGSRTQREREDSLRAFRSGKCPILVATGVSARGLDVHSVMHVINFDLPSTTYGGIEEYTHRIGRTGRIGNLGLASSFFTNRDEDLGEALVKTLLETQQVVPDFLAHHIPEGFTADGSGDVTKLRFDADSDNEVEADGADSAAAGGWGVPAAVPDANPTTAGGWGVPAAVPDATPAAAGGWGTPAPVPNAAPATAGGWGTPAAVSVTAPAAAGGWGTPAPVPVAAPAAAGGWGNPAPPSYDASIYGPPQPAPSRPPPPAPTRVPPPKIQGGW